MAGAVAMTSKARSRQPATPAPARRKNLRATGDSFFEGFTLYWLSVASNTAERGLTQLLQATVELSLPEWRVMLLVGKMPGLSTDAIADKTTMDKSKVSRAIARLGALGYVERTVPKTDRRLNSLAITKSGKRVFERCLEIAETAQADFVSPLSSAEHDTLFALLARLSTQSK
jgi:DNA-binding MarR family transcriptional regulator